MAVDPVPEHLHTVTPRLVLRDSRGAIEFYRAAFGAELLDGPHLGPGDIVIHAEIRIGDASVYLTDEGEGADVVAPSANGNRVTALMAVTVPDVDRLWQRAVDAGCEVIHPLADQFYGDRGGRLRDPFGQQWMLSTHIEDVSPEEMERRMRAWAEDAG